jgi:hypothetical protein
MRWTLVVGDVPVTWFTAATPTRRPSLCYLPRFDSAPA